MVIDDLILFNKLARACGNRYIAVEFVSKTARKLGKANKRYRISEAMLLNWVITGQCPYTEAQLAQMQVKEDDDGVSDMLSEILDKEVVSEVVRFYKMSVRRHRLIECTRKDSHCFSWTIQSRCLSFAPLY